MIDKYLTHSNPLKSRIQEERKSYDLDEFVERANQNWFVIDSGLPYFVNTRMIGGQEVKFMDRKSEGLLMARHGRSKPTRKRDVMDRRGEMMSASDTDLLNAKLEQLGATARYRQDGSRYLIETVGTVS